MKKSLLLLGAAFFAFNGFAEDVDITPSGYYFYKTGEMCAEAGGGYHGANIQTAPDGKQFAANLFYEYGFDQMYDNGLLVIGGGQYHNSANDYYVNTKAGFQIVDLGGEVGPCLTFVYNDNTAVNEALKEATGRDCGVTAATAGALNWFNLNFFTDPNNTPVASQGSIRVRVVCNVFSPKYGTGNIVNNVHFKTQENGMKGDGYGAITANEFFKKTVDPENEDNTINVYDPTKWLEYEFVSVCPDKTEDKEFGYSPMRLVLNLPAGAPAEGTTIFIREISFWQTDAEFDEKQAETHDYITLNMGEATPAGISDVVVNDAANYSVNGNIVTFTVPAVVYTLTGAKVATGTSATLAKGVYVATVGGKAVKFAVK